MPLSRAQRKRRIEQRWHPCDDAMIPRTQAHMPMTQNGRGTRPPREELMQPRCASLLRATPRARLSPPLPRVLPLQLGFPRRSSPATKVAGEAVATRSGELSLLISHPGLPELLARNAALVLSLWGLGGGVGVLLCHARGSLAAAIRPLTHRHRNSPNRPAPPPPSILLVTLSVLLHQLN